MQHGWSGPCSPTTIETPAVFCATVGGLSQMKRHTSKTSRVIICHVARTARDQEREKKEGKSEREIEREIMIQRKGV